MIIESATRLEGESMIQIFVKTYPGTITLDLQPNDTIQSIKLKIENKQHIPHHLQRLIYSGKELDECRNLSNYNIQNGSTIHLKISASSSTFDVKEQTTICINTLTNKTLMLDVELDDTIKSVKAQIQNETGKPHEQQVLIFAGKQLDDARTLCSYGIKTNDKLWLVIERAVSMGWFPGTEILNRKYAVNDPIEYKSKPPAGSGQPHIYKEYKGYILIVNRNINRIVFKSEDGEYSKLELENKIVIKSEDGAYLNLRLEDIKIKLPHKSIQIFIQRFMKELIVLNVQSNDTIQNVKREIYDKYSILPNEQALFYEYKERGRQGLITKDDHEKWKCAANTNCLLECDIHHKSTVIMIQSGEIWTYLKAVNEEIDALKWEYKT